MMTNQAVADIQLSNACLLITEIENVKNEEAQILFLLLITLHVDQFDSFWNLPVQEAFRDDESHALTIAERLLAEGEDLSDC